MSSSAASTRENNPLTVLADHQSPTWRVPSARLAPPELGHDVAVVVALDLDALDHARGAALTSTIVCRRVKPMIDPPLRVASNGESSGTPSKRNLVPARALERRRGLHTGAAQRICRSPGVDVREQGRASLGRVRAALSRAMVLAPPCSPSTAATRWRSGRARSFPASSLHCAPRRCSGWPILSRLWLPAPPTRIRPSMLLMKCARAGISSAWGKGSGPGFSPSARP
jgi:hypothetical protein